MKLRIIAAACAALAFGPSAWAAASAEATLSNLTFTLYDLNPTDGIDAAVEFQTNGSYGSYVTSTANDSSLGSQGGSRWSFSFLGPASSTSSVGGTSATGSVSGSLSSGVTLSASGVAPGYSFAVPGSFFNSASFAASARAGSDFGTLGFSLSPFTLLVIGGQTSLTATTTVGAKVTDFFFESETASASLNMQVSGRGPTGLEGSSQSSSDNAGVSAGYDITFDPWTGSFAYIGQSFTTERQVAVSFTNLSGASLDGSLSISVAANGSSPLPAVPEPGSVALLLAGLGVVGLRLRRQQAA